MSKKTNRIAALLLMLCVVCCTLWLFLRPRLFSSAHFAATIWADGEAVRKIDLSAADDEIFSIEEETGLRVTIEIKDHRIRFLSSDCPDHICIHTGWIGEPAQTAVCMPNRVSVTIAEST